MLSALGLALVILTLVTLALTGGWDREGDYVPPRVQDGRIVPGEVRRPDEAEPVAPELPVGDDGG